ncbi:MAG: ABC transporter permease, partial [Bacteroidota bacterium]
MLKLLRDTVESFFVEVGQYGLLIARSFSSIGEFKTYRENLLSQLVRIGVDSLPIVALASAFSGMVLTVQTAYQLFSPFIPRSIIGGVVVPSMILELGIVTPALVLAGRVGARIAAELGTMRVTEQVDALEAMGLNSVAYLVVPRVLAGVIMFPVLYAAASFVGITGGMLAGSLGGYLTAQEFIEGAREWFKPYDVVFGSIKALVFGYLITSISCAKGFFTTGGAEGV